MGEVCHPWWYLCRERLITVPSFVPLSPWEVGQGKSLMNNPRIPGITAHKKKREVLQIMDTQGNRLSL